MKINAVIIDDMPDALELLKGDIEHYCPNIEIVGTANSVVSGAKLVKQVKPDLLFLDIELGDGTGFDILDLVAPILSHIIFTTASNEYAIRAFRYAAVDYLLKPVDNELLTEAVDRVQDKMGSMDDRLGLAATVYKNQGNSETMALHTSEEIKIVAINEIIRCQSNDNYTMFYFEDQSKILISKTLKYFDGLLNNHNFLRVHQSHLVNPKQIETFNRKDGGYLSMRDGSQVPVSMRKKSMVLDFLR